MMAVKNERHISLTLTSQYASSWGTWEGVRELIQNWHDGIQDIAAGLDIHIEDAVNNAVCFEQVKGKDTEFEACIKQTNGQKISLGHLTYDKFSNILSLTNHKTALQKKILLLGYSAKSDKSEIIGQFGEGLKIGALALVRKGHIVTMETRDDHWRFELIHNEEFGEKVLTVVVTDRTQTEDITTSKEETSCVPTEITDTCTIVRGLTLTDWKFFIPRFLFLKPPKDCVKTALGTLLLDSELAGQLYVKGLWVGDLRSEDLAAGVSFSSLQLDRDRNAVPKPSEIDHVLSCIWIKAIEKRQDLLARYFCLLRDDRFRDVRHAAQYSSDIVATKISDQFLKEYGDNAFPVLNSTVVQKIQAVRDDLHREVILCNQQLLDILLKSGKYLTLKDALDQVSSCKRENIPYSSLSDAQQRVLRKVTELVKMADPSFSLGLIDISSIHDKMENCSCQGSRVMVPSWFLDTKAVHNTGRLCESDNIQDMQCYCCEVKLCHAILEARKDRLPVANFLSPVLEVGFMEKPDIAFTDQSSAVVISQINHVLLFVIHGLMSNAKMGKMQNTSAIKSAALVTGDIESVDLMKAESIEREQKYIQRVVELQDELEAEKEKFAKQLSDIKQKLTSAESDLMAREISTVNCEQTLRNQFEAQRKKMVESAQDSIKALQEEIKQKDESLLTLRLDLNKKDKLLKEIRQEKESLELAVDKRTEGLLDELSHYVTQHRNRTESLSRLCKEGCRSDDKATRDKCLLLSNMCELILQDLQQEKFICAVCKIKRKDCLLQPCGHYSICQTCATEITRSTKKCPICKETFTRHLKVYE